MIDHTCVIIIGKTPALPEVIESVDLRETT